MKISAKITRYTYLLAVLLLIGFGVRSAGNSFHSISIDEAWDLCIAQTPTIALIKTLASPPPAVLWPPPLHYLILHYLLSPPSPDMLINARFFSTVISILGLGLFIWSLPRTTNPASRVFVTLMLLLHPFQHFWAQQSRSYMLLQLLTVASYFLLNRFYRHPSIGRAFPYFLVILAGAYTHYYFLLGWASGVMLVLLIPPPQDRKKFFKLFIVTQLVFIILYLPWSPVMLRRLIDRDAVGAGNSSSPANTLRSLSFLLVGYPTPKVGIALLARYCGIASFAALFIAGIATLRRKWYALIPILLPLTITVLVALFTPTFAARYLIIIHLPLYWVVWHGLAGSRSRILTAITILHILCLSYGTWYIATHEYPYGQDFKSASSWVISDWQDGDVILCEGIQSQPAINNYFLPLAPARFDFIDRTQAGTIPGRHLWLVWCHWQYMDPEGTLLTEVAAKYELVEKRSFTGLEIFRFRQREE